LAAGPVCAGVGTYFLLGSLASVESQAIFLLYVLMYTITATILGFGWFRSASRGHHVYIFMMCWFDAAAATVLLYSIGIINMVVFLLALVGALTGMFLSFWRAKDEIYRNYHNRR
jgi:hypothetical protein